MVVRCLRCQINKLSPKMEKQVTATLVSRINGERVRVHATTDHPSSSYGIAVWVDDEGTAYCQCGFETWYDVIDIKEVK